MNKDFVEESEDAYEDSQEEVAADSGFDLRGKSLKNTTKREGQDKKQALPMKTIMSQILAKPAGQTAQGVLCNFIQKTVAFSKKKVIIKNVLKERKNAKLEAIKSHLKKKEQSLGKVFPNFAKEREYERKLKMTAVEGSRSLLMKSLDCFRPFSIFKRIRSILYQTKSTPN